MDRQLGLLKAVDKMIPEPRNPKNFQHSQLSLLQQRVYGLRLSYEDLNDHEHLRTDSAIQTTVNREQDLGSQSTLCRMDRAVDSGVHEIKIEQFIASYKKPPKKLTFNFDATDNAVHGIQDGRFIYGFYGHYCFLPWVLGDVMLTVFLYYRKLLKIAQSIY